MSGHSKWKNIEHRKGRQDASRGQLFTRLCRDVYVAAKRKGANPDVNYALKVALDRARAASVPSDTLARTLAKATGTLPGVVFEDFMYEGYGPAGIAILLRMSSDNRNRTAAEVRHLFSRAGGSLGEAGCVLWMFKRTGVIEVPRAGMAQDDDAITLLALECDVDDMESGPDAHTLYVDPERLTEVEQALEAAGANPTRVNVDYLPTTSTSVPAQDEERVLDLLGALEERDDVEAVYTNAEFAEA
ncbi:MAG: YebC/PmpR family DNA-binding transcriptional regulator [Firmicutes bacterium]|nr:YebC/PmpR family DNA-binding transcriptional regulator [Bacillota bacterium]